MPRKVSANRQAKQGRPIQIPVHWGAVDHLPTLYANQLFITNAGQEVYLVFGEITPPVVVNPADLPKQLEIKPVAKIAVSREAMLKFREAINAIAQNLPSTTLKVEENK
ncbi:MAG: hypothetical protein HYR71_03155 [Chloroflexi bacterium]|nr:hypothetical protein [Chloroflexota bacterium]